MARLPRKKAWTLLAALPLLLYLHQQFAANEEQVRKFVAFAREQRGKVFASALVHPDHPFRQVVRHHRLEGGYSDDFAGSEVRFLTGNTIPVSRTYEEVNTPLSLRVDALERPFWSGAMAREMGEYFRALDLPHETVSLPRPFGNLLIPGKAALRNPGVSIDEFAVKTALHEQEAPAMRDRSIQTFWSTVRPQKKGDFFVVDLGISVPLDRMLLIPESFVTGPNAFSLEVSEDARDWHRLQLFENHRGPVFVSVFHPMIKIVKPRIELNLGEGRGRFLKLQIEADGLFPLSIRELYVYRRGEEGLSQEDLSLEVRRIEETIRRWPRARIVGDHWFQSSYALKGYPVLFLPNRFTDLYGTENPALSSFEPVPLSQEPLIVISRKEDSPGLHELLSSEQLLFQKKEFVFFDVYYLDKQGVRNPLYWDGVRLCYLSATPGRRQGPAADIGIATQRVAREMRTEEAAEAQPPPDTQGGSGRIRP